MVRKEFRLVRLTTAFTSGYGVAGELRRITQKQTTTDATDVRRMTAD